MPWIVNTTLSLIENIFSILQVYINVAYGIGISSFGIGNSNVSIISLSIINIGIDIRSAVIGIGIGSIIISAYFLCVVWSLKTEIEDECARGSYSVPVPFRKDEVETRFA